MRLDPRIEEIISSQIASQFPDFYREEGPIFVAFVQKYYEWLESEGQALYHSRRQLSYRDIDTTIDDFLVFFTRKYLNGIQLETESNVRQLIKHSLDLYRTKGSERSIDLLFRLVFGVGAQVYFPSKDVFKLSSGQWIVPTYLEVVDRGSLDQFLGVQVEGTASGARGFVERIVRKKTPSKYVDVMYLSDVKGVFQAGETVNKSFNPISESVCPVVIGSLDSLTVVNGGGGYEVGDIVDLTSVHGYGGKARVTAVTQADGRVSLELVDGGFGYTVNAEILISNAILTLSGMAGTGGEYFELFDQITQSTATVEYEGANGEFTRGTQVFTYHANNDLRGIAWVADVNAANATHGNLVLSVVSGNVDGGPFYTTANAVTANQSSISWSNAVGNVIATGESTVLLTGRVGDFQFGETVVQNTTRAVVTAVAGDQLYLTDLSGTFSIGSSLSGELSGATGVVNTVSVAVGVTGSNNFVAGGYHHAVHNEESLRVVTSSFGSGFSMEIGTLSDEETVDINTDFLSDYVDVNLDAAAYGFPADPTANLADTLAAALSFDSYEIGQVETVNLLNPGEGYAVPPMIRIYEPAIYGLGRTGYALDFVGASGTFGVGETVSQGDAKGVVLTSNTTVLTLKRLTVGSSFVPTSNSTTRITGASSGTTANVVGVSALSEGAMSVSRTGSDAVFTTQSTTEDGYVESLSVVDSGLGYVDGLQVSFGLDGRDSGVARVSSQTQGTSQGYYKRKGGFLSSTKKLFDGHYYQEFSYDVRSAKAIDDYADMLRQVVHMAGTKMFGTLVTDSRLSANVEISTSIVTKSFTLANTTVSLSPATLSSEGELDSP